VTGQLALALLLALASAVALNWGFYRQHEQVSALPPLSPRRPVRSLVLLFSDVAWLVGFLVGILGWALYIAALAFGPLSLVQAASAGGIGVLALLVWRLGGVVLVRREWAGVGVSIGGLLLLGLSLLGRGGHDSGSHGSWPAIAVWIAVSWIAAAGFAGPLGRFVAAGAHQPVFLARAAGGVDVVEPVGPWCGISEDVERGTSEYEFHVGEGDVLCLITDGIVEARGAGDDLFGQERLADVLGRGAAPAPSVLEAIFSSVEGFAVQQEDDMTAVVLKRKEPHARA